MVALSKIIMHLMLFPSKVSFIIMFLIYKCEHQKVKYLSLVVMFSIMFALLLKTLVFRPLPIGNYDFNWSFPDSALMLIVIVYGSMAVSLRDYIYVSSYTIILSALMVINNKIYLSDAVLTIMFSMILLCFSEAVWHTFSRRCAYSILLVLSLCAIPGANSFSSIQIIMHFQLMLGCFLMIVLIKSLRKTIALHVFQSFPFALSLQWKEKS